MVGPELFFKSLSADCLLLKTRYQQPKGILACCPLGHKSNNDDDEVLELKERLAAYNLDSSPENSAGNDTEVPQEPVQKKQANKKVVMQMDSDDDFEEEIAAAPKGGRKKAAGKPKAAASKPPAAAKKRGTAANKKQPQTSSGQKLLTDMLKPAESSGASPELKVRKMRASPFNKKSGSVMGRVGLADEMTESDDKVDSPSAEERSEAPVAARARPQRANRRQTRYVLSDSESEPASEDSDFDAVDDIDED